MLKSLQEIRRRYGKRGDRGASAVEYGLLVALIAVVVAGAAWALGSALKGQFGTVTACVTAAQGAASNSNPQNPC
jgi:pilus assembly protein Flp/PilA